MSTMMKTTLIAALLFGLAPSVQAQERGTHANPQTYNQQRAYGTNGPDWRYRDEALSARAQRPDGRITRSTTPSNRVIRDDPPGSAWQDRGIREDLGLPGQ